MAAYFAEGSEAMVALEAMVDRVGVANVLFALAHICYAKADHVESNWNDHQTAREWTMRGHVLDGWGMHRKMHDAD